MTAPSCLCPRHTDPASHCTCTCPDSLHGRADWVGLVAVTVCEAS